MLVRCVRPALASARLVQQATITTSHAPAKSEPAPMEEYEVDDGFRSKIWEVLKLKDEDAHKLWVAKDDTVFSAIKKMTAAGVGSLLVYDPTKAPVADGDHPTQTAGCVGIITERDYMNKVALVGKSSSKTPVCDIMTPVERMRALAPSNTVLEAMHLMVMHNIRHVPVMDDHAMVGVLSMRDVMRSLLDDQKQEINVLKDYIGGSY